MAPSQWSLRLRLVAGVVVLVAIALAVTGTLGVALLRSYLVRQVDQQLIGLASQPRGPADVSPRGRPGNGTPQDAQDLPTPFVFAVVSSQGTVLWQAGGSTSGNSRRPNLSGLDAAQVSAKGDRPFTVSAIGGGSGFRVLARPDNGMTAVTAISLNASDQTVSRLEKITAFVALIVLAVLVVTAALMVKLGLRPLTAVEQTAVNIARGDLSRRVRPGRPNTEIGRLATTLNSMLSQIEAAFAARDRTEATLRQFIADASHELRTPLTTVRGYAELVNRGALPDEAEQRHALERIEAEAVRMGDLVDDLLLLAYLDQRRPLQVVRADMRELVADAVADAQARDQQRRIEYVPPGGPAPVEVDVNRMRQVLTNLLSNALVHTPPEAAVRVELAADRRRVRISVADDGPGIAPEHLGRLFERFYRADPGRSRARGGTGLGLSIVAAVVGASGGSVTCASAPGAGTTFTVDLPIATSLAESHISH